MAQLQNEPGTLTNELGSPALHLQTHLIILLKGLAMFQIDSWSELCNFLLTTESPNVYIFGYLVGRAKYGEVDC